MQRTIVEERAKNAVIMDVFSRLIQERIIFIDGFIDEELANGVIAQMLYLNSLNDKTIHVYINSPGGDVMSGLAIYDISEIVKAPIKTVCVGSACSMAAILMLMGKERCGLKHSRIMLHQVRGGGHDVVEQVRINLKEMEAVQAEMYSIVKNKTTIEDIEKSFMFDKWYTAQEALECGLLTSIL